MKITKHEDFLIKKITEHLSNCDADSIAEIFDNIFYTETTPEGGQAFLIEYSERDLSASFFED